MFLGNFTEKFELINHGIRLPEFIMSDEDYSFYGIDKKSSNIDILTALARYGYKDKLSRKLIPQERASEYGDRVRYELSVLAKTNFEGYILLVWDVMNFVRKNDLARGRGRGSAAGSLINYLVGITDVDPIKYNLFFERFISESRAKTNIVDGVMYLAGSAPDVDIDLGDEDREKVIEYVANKYKGRFVKLSTVGTLTTKILTKELGKIFGYSDEYMGVVSDHIPMLYGKVYSPSKSYKESEGYKRFIDENPRILKLSEMLHEGINHIGSHASAYSVSFDLLEDFMPIQLGSDGEIVSTYDMYEAQNLSVKLDLLGVQTINLIQNVARRVGIDLDQVNLEDYETIFKYLQQLEHPYGLFQISGHTAIRANNKIKPRSVDHASGLLSIARPGALSQLDLYADYVNNGTVQDCPLIFLDVLSPTGGVCLYQEQLMSMFVKLGFNLVEANTIRDIVGKKKKDKIAEWEPKIYEKAKGNNIPESAAKYVWDLANASADYSFNRSHSIAYSITALLSVYCKFNHPKEFFLEALAMSQKKQDPFEQIALIEAELPYFGVKLLPPDLLKSEMEFVIEGDNIRFGLSAIKGVSDKSLIKLQSFLDKDKANKFQVFHAAKETGLNIGVLSALIQAGCLSSLGTDRPRMVFEAQTWSKLNERERDYCLSNGGKYGYDLITAMQDYMNWDKKSKESRLSTIRKNTEPYSQIFKQNSEYPKFANFAYEKAVLGYSPTQTLKGVFEKEHPELKTCDEIKNQVDKDNECCIVATVIEVRKSESKAGNDYMKMTLSDETGAITGIMVGAKLNKFLLTNTLPKEDQIVYVEGTKNEDGMWINKCAEQTYKIYLKTSDLRKDKNEKNEA